MSDQIDIDHINIHSESEAQLAKEIASDEWLRVSPIAILYFFVKTLFFLVNNVLIYMLPVFAFNLSELKDNPVMFAAIGLSAVMLVMIASIVKYFFYFYRFSADRVEIRQGLIKKTHMDLPFGKIQNVKVIQPLYYRFSDFSIVELDTAGSAQQEANIVAIRLPVAESFKQKVQAITTNKVNLVPNQDNYPSTKKEKSHTEVMLNQRSMKDIIIHGITNNRVWIFLGFLAPFYNAIAENVGTLFANFGLNVASYLNYETQSAGTFILHLISIVTLVMLIIVLLSIVGSIFIFYDYRLSRSGDRYIRRSGLLTKHEISMKVSRIQRAVQQQDWLDIIIGRVNLRFEQNSTGVANANQVSQINSANKLIVPSVSPLEADELVQDVFNSQRLSQVEYKHISPRFILRLLIYPCAPLLVLLSTMILSQSLSLNAFIAVAATACLLFSFCVLRWYRWGFERDDSFIYIRQGFLGRDYCVFPISKMQQTKLLQTPFMREKKLATLRMVIASGGVTIPYLPLQDATLIIDYSLLKIAKDKPAWM